MTPTPRIEIRPAAPRRQPLAIPVAAAFAVLAMMAGAEPPVTAAEPPATTADAPAADPAEVLPIAPEEAPIRTFIDTTYALLIRAVQEDLPRQRQARDRWARQYMGAKRLSPEKRRQFSELLKWQNKLIAAHEQILDAIKQMNGGRAAKAMARAIAAEAKLDALVPKRPERTWLTFEEMDAYIATKRRPARKLKEGTLPLSRIAWEPDRPETKGTEDHG